METTSWELIDGANNGDSTARAEFVRRYRDQVRQLLQHRWTSQTAIAFLEDALQDVFLECFKQDGALSSAAPGRDGGFRRYLAAVTRNVARRYERDGAKHRVRHNLSEDVTQQVQLETSLSRMLDREWARTLVREAAREQGERASASGPTAVLRVELLRTRFEHGLSIAEIAAKWGKRPDYLHHQYAKARSEFLAALRLVVARRLGGSGVEVEARCKELMDLLG